MGAINVVGLKLKRMNRTQYYQELMKPQLLNQNQNRSKIQLVSLQKEQTTIARCLLFLQ